ncbi:MAG: Rrf2 family transcriptional regulator [Planctomycetes bacterium]|nr:Rrf2 family transcriptional regulator [Planctomycetota bacterium]
MILSRSADYALRALIYLAQASGEQPVPLERIASEQRIPAALLSKILQALVKAEVLRSHRGYGGGFVLVADPAALTIDVVIQAIDGPFTVFECMEDEHFCHLCSSCKLRTKLFELQAAMIGVLRGVTIADCVPDATGAPRRPLPTVVGPEPGRRGLGPIG